MVSPEKMVSSTTASDGNSSSPPSCASNETVAVLTRPYPPRPSSTRVTSIRLMLGNQPRMLVERAGDDITCAANAHGHVKGGAASLRQQRGDLLIQRQHPRPRRVAYQLKELLREAKGSGIGAEPPGHLGA